MSLLWMEYESSFQNLVDAAFQCELNSRPEYFSSLSPRVRKIIQRDTRYNVDFLYTAYTLDDTKIMEDYARWLFRLMDSVFVDRSTSETADYVVRHFDCICQAVSSALDAEKQAHVMELLDAAKNAVQDEAQKPFTALSHTSRYEKEIHQYLDSLLQKNSRNSMFMIQKFCQQGIPLSDIYVEILAESMRRIGEMWHTAQITVDTEHFCTSVTQMAMAQLYPVIFSQERKNKAVLCACPGTELHEMGARMVADLFENDGWDSVYLGAAVPEDALMDSIRENDPDLLTLSISMPQHLIECQTLVERIRREFPDLRIAVGGNAFRSTHEIWKQWPIDIYTEDARELIKRANEE